MSNYLKITFQAKCDTPSIEDFCSLIDPAPLQGALDPAGVGGGGRTRAGVGRGGTPYPST